MRRPLCLLVVGVMLGTEIPDAWGQVEGEGGGSQVLPAGGEGREDARPPEEATERVPVNRADADHLMRLPGIGSKKARALIEARERRPFRRPSDLRRVKGFGPRTILRLAPLLRFD